MPLKNLIERAEEVSLSDQDISHYLRDNINIHRYSDLQSIRTVNDFLSFFHPKSKACILLYQISSQTSGHWVCLYFEENNTTLHFYDSYGKPPDAIYNINQELRSNLGIPLLSYWLNLLQKEYSTQIQYNPYKHQTNLRNIQVNTCGRWVLARLKFKHLDNKQFNDMFQSFRMKPDEVVTLMTITSSAGYERLAI